MLTLSDKKPVISRRMATWRSNSIFLLSAAAVLFAGASPHAGTAAQGTPKPAIAARDILKKNCASCHNGSLFFDASLRASLAVHVVKPGDPDGSLLISKIAAGDMPPGSGAKVSAEDLKTLKEWVKDGAPDWNLAETSVNPSDSQLLKAIVSDLEATPEEQRSFIRYFSIANLLRNPEAAEASPVAGVALAKLVNSLSWRTELVAMKPFGPSNALYKLDIRDVDWSPAIWEEILSRYPYGYVPENERAAVQHIRILTGAAVPYIRADWFLATASVPPLYHDILHLPDHVSGKGGLEEMLGVDAARDQEQDKIVRAGLENSGVSHSNRAVERHASLYGYYYKSFDFATSEGRKNIFQFPLDFKEDGGEFIWSLPNGMQAYMVAKSTGQRLDVAPSAIVSDRSGVFDDVNVTNGLSCISCHANGMRFFDDEVRQALDTTQQPDSTNDRAKIWYVPTPQFRQILLADAKKFEAATVKVGGIFPHDGEEPCLDPKLEPVTRLAVLYRSRPVTVNEAAAECGLTTEVFQERLAKSPKLAELGLTLLGKPKPVPGAKGEPAPSIGSVKRDIWEQDFSEVIDQIGAGESIKATSKPVVSAFVDPRITVRLELDGHTPLTARLKSQLYFRFLKSDLLKPVSRGGDKLLKLTVLDSSGPEVVLRAESGTTRFEATGDREEFASVADQLADQIHRGLTGLPVPPDGSLVPRPEPPANPGTTRAAPQDPSVGFTVPGASAQLIELASRAGAAGAAVAVDRGPGSTYKLGDDITIRFSLAQDSFAAIYNVDAAGQVTLLFPNTHGLDNHLTAGRVYVSGDPWYLAANGTPGRERIFLLTASSNDQLPGVREILQNPESQPFVSKSVGVFARTVHTATQGASAAAIGASVVEFFTSK